MLQSTVILLHCVCSKVNIFAMNLDFRENRAIVCFGGLFFGVFFCYKDHVTRWHSGTIPEALKQLLFLLAFAGVIAGGDSQREEAVLKGV